MGKELIQVTLGGDKVRIQKGTYSKIKTTKSLYQGKAQDYEEVYRELMQYHVIEPQSIQTPDDFRKITDFPGARGRISDELVDALEQTDEYKQMIAWKVKTQDLQLKSGLIRKGVLLPEQNSWIYIDKKGVFRARDYKTGAFTALPGYYGLTPIWEIKNYL